MSNFYVSETSYTEALIINNGSISVGRVNELEADVLEGQGNEIIPLAESGLDLKVAMESVAFLYGRRSKAPALFEEFTALVSTNTIN